MNTIQEQWNSFEAQVVSKKASSAQINDMKNTFYAGALAMINIGWNIGSQQLSEDAAFAIYKGCNDEVTQFFDEQLEQIKALKQT